MSRGCTSRCPGASAENPVPQMFGTGDDMPRRLKKRRSATAMRCHAGQNNADYLSIIQRYDQERPAGQMYHPVRNSAALTSHRGLSQHRCQLCFQNTPDSSWHAAAPGSSWVPLAARKRRTCRQPVSLTLEPRSQSFTCFPCPTLIFDRRYSGGITFMPGMGRSNVRKR